MSAKPVASDSSGHTGSIVADFIQRIAQDFAAIFPSALGRNEPQNDESSSTNDPNLCTIFDPVDFSACSNTSNNNKYSSNSFHKSISQTVLTNKDSAWFFTGNEGAAMDDYTETDGSTQREDEDDYDTGFISVKAPQQSNRSKMKKIDRHHYTTKKNSSKKHNEIQQICDKTTFWLGILCIFLTIILAILVGVLRPFRSVNNRKSNNNYTSGQTDIAMTPQDPDESAFMAIPTVTPVVGIVPTAASNSGTGSGLGPKPSPTVASTQTRMPQNPTESPAASSDFSPTGYPIVHQTGAKYPTVNPASSIPTKDATISSRVPPSITPKIDEEEQDAMDEAESAVAEEPADSAGDRTEVPNLSMGPLVGHTSHNSVTLWAYHDFIDYNMEILLYDSSRDELIRTIDLVSPRKDRNNAVIETLTGLEASTAYKYGMHIDGERVGKGSFETAPFPGAGGSKFDYVLASCMNYRQYKNQIVWEAIVDSLGGRYPDFSIMAGDTVYLQEGVDVTKKNGVDFDRLWFRNKEQRNEVHFSEFIRNTPTYAIWNDHEYGSNDGDKDQKGKFKSLRAWESLWANPGYGDEESDDGVYYSYYWGDVHYIVTDDHWFRDPSTENRLGTKQTEWIRDELVNSNGTFKVIVIGSDIMERGWYSDLSNIGDIVRENSIDGVLFHAGDIHRNEYKRKDTGGFPYPVTQVTSSGIAKVWRRPFVHIAVNTLDSDPSITAYFYGAQSLTDTTTWSNDPDLRCSSIVGIDRDKEHSCTEKILLSEISVPK